MFLGKMADLFKYLCLSLGIPIPQSKKDKIKQFVQYSQALSHTNRRSSSLRKSVIDEMSPLLPRSRYLMPKIDTSFDVSAPMSITLSNPLTSHWSDVSVPSSLPTSLPKPSDLRSASFACRGLMSTCLSGFASYETLVEFCKTYTKPSKTCRPWMISIDGNIGAGKTSFLRKIQQDVDPKRVVIVYEPTDVCTKLEDLSDEMSLLQKYYTYPNMYSFMFQTVMFHAIIQSIEEAIENNPDCDIILCERSIKTSRNVFGKMLVEDQYMTSFEHRVYESFFTPRICDLYYPDQTIWLDVPLNVCLERIIYRSKEGEKIINMDYLQRIESLYFQENKMDVVSNLLIL
jgi:deoxyadenosine/deoxycytidine kinase